MIKTSLFSELCRIVEEGGLRDIIKGKFPYPTGLPTLNHILAEAKLFYFQQDWDLEYGPESQQLGTVFKNWENLWSKFRLPFRVTAIETPRDVLVIVDKEPGQIGLTGPRWLLSYRPQQEPSSQGYLCIGTFANFRWDPSDPTGLDFRAERTLPFGVLVDRRTYRPFPTKTNTKMVTGIAGHQFNLTDPLVLMARNREPEDCGLFQLPTKSPGHNFTTMSSKLPSAEPTTQQEHFAVQEFMGTYVPYSILKVAHISNPNRFVVERVPKILPQIRAGKIARGGERSVYILLDLKFIRETLKLGQPVEGAVSTRAGGPRRSHWRVLGAECYRRDANGDPRAIEIPDHWVGTRQGLWQGMVYIIRPEV